MNRNLILLDYDDHQSMVTNLSLFRDYCSDLSLSSIESQIETWKINVFGYENMTRKTKSVKFTKEREPSVENIDRLWYIKLQLFCVFLWTLSIGFNWYKETTFVFYFLCHRFKHPSYTCRRMSSLILVHVSIKDM